MMGYDFTLPYGRCFHNLSKLQCTYCRYAYPAHGPLALLSWSFLKLDSVDPNICLAGRSLMRMTRIVLHRGVDRSRLRTPGRGVP